MLKSHVLVAVKEAAAAVTARKLAHQFPLSSAAYAWLGLALYQTLMRECCEPSSKQQRCLILQVLKHHHSNS